MNESKQFYNLKIFHWLDERYHISDLIGYMKKKSVPNFRATVWYYFGGIALLLFIVQVVTGILLLMYYKGSSDLAYESVRYIDSKVNFGWLIRSIHSWSANLFIFAVFVHMFSVYFFKVFRKPRELTWYTGIALLLFSLTFGFSGYLLPWNELSFFATKVGTDIIGQLPLVGKYLLKLLRGGNDVTGATLSRFFGLHVAILPGLFTVILTFHLLFIQRQGVSEPEKWQNTPESQKSYIPFFPNFVLREFLIWLIVIANEFASAPTGIKPEWYFISMFQVLKFLPGEILFLPGEVLGILLFGVGILLWVFVPVWDKKTNEGSRNRLINYIGIFVVLFMIIFTFLGYYLD